MEDGSISYSKLENLKIYGKPEGRGPRGLTVEYSASFEYLASALLR